MLTAAALPLVVGCSKSMDQVLVLPPLDGDVCVGPLL